MPVSSVTAGQIVSAALWNELAGVVNPVETKVIGVEAGATLNRTDAATDALLTAYTSSAIFDALALTENA